MLFYVLLTIFSKSCYKNNFWIEKNTNNMNEVITNNPHTLNFGEKYWLELNRRIYIFSCSINYDSNYLTCLLLKPSGLNLVSIDNFYEEQIPKFFNYLNLFFRVAICHVCPNGYSYYNIATTTSEGYLKGSVKVSLNELTVRLTRPLNRFNNLFASLENFNWFVEKRFYLLSGHSAEYAVNLEYLVTSYTGSSKFITTTAIFTEAFGFKKCNYSGINQMIWFGALDEPEAQTEPIKEGDYNHLDHFQSPLQLFFETNTRWPIFLVEGEICEPIMEKDGLLKLNVNRIQTYLALEKETRLPKWRITIPTFYNEIERTDGEVLVFMLFSKLEQTKDGYREIMLESFSLTGESQLLSQDSKHNKIKCVVCVELKEGNELSMRMMLLGEKINDSKDVLYAIEYEGSEIKEVDKPFYNTEFIRYFNGVLLSSKKIKKGSKTDLSNSQIRHFSNMNDKIKLWLMILFGFTSLALLLMFIFFLRKKNLKIRMKYNKNKHYKAKQ